MFRKKNLVFYIFCGGGLKSYANKQEQKILNINNISCSYVTIRITFETLR